MRLPVQIIFLASLLTATAGAQDDQTLVRVELRVITAGPSGAIVVDRGTRDGLAVGDFVFFYPRGGASYKGAITQVDERSSVVEMRDRGFVPKAGTRGRVQIPRSRIAPVAPPTLQTDPPKQPGRQGDPAAKPRWENEDEEWEPGMSLLSQMKPIRPEDRGMQVSGRVYSSGDLRWDDSQDFDNSFLRVGTQLDLDNPFGKGGGIHFDAEIDYRTEQNEKTGFDLLGRRFSYRWGGTRFQQQRFEAGRFLQHGMPEFGILDGVEFDYRRKNGHRFGGSIGFMPELDDDFESGEDFQFAGFYNWTPDNSERILFGGGYQKSFHNGKTDRDLFVIKSRYLPLEPGWNFHGTLWVDLYGGRDDEKNGGLELTQAFLSAGRENEQGDGVDLFFRRVRFAETLRNEFPPLQAGELANNRYDRLGLDAWTEWSDETTLRSHISGYDDEDDHGAALELGADVENWLSERSLTNAALFGTLGQHSNSFGGRLSYGRSVENGRWDLFYEIGHHRIAGFQNDRDDILQHRLRASRDLFTESGWSISLYAEGFVFDEELSFGAGFYVQRNFHLRRTY